MDKNKEIPIEIVSLEELQEVVEATLCPNCGAEVAGHDSDDWGLCESCWHDMEANEPENYKPLRF